MTHKFPRLEWTPCTEPPDDWRYVLVWHRSRPYNRFYKPVVGWWNTEEWRREDSHSVEHGNIYQPKFWRDIEPPK